MKDYIYTYRDYNDRHQYIEIRQFDSLKEAVITAACNEDFNNGYDLEGQFFVIDDRLPTLSEVQDMTLTQLGDLFGIEILDEDAEYVAHNHMVIHRLRGAGTQNSPYEIEL